MLGKVFKDEDALDVGHMYYYVDAARGMAMNPDAKMIHISCEACDDDSCTMDIVPTSEEEKEAFASKDGG